MNSRETPDGVHQDAWLSVTTSKCGITPVRKRVSELGVYIIDWYPMRAQDALSTKVT